mmetsp:Transcript_8589/g.14558  ORF Transcript_8589/g.14558 Transcript_8589/m.14558 type:complete len:223 (-) Transcript_8589:445-1113(-)
MRTRAEFWASAALERRTLVGSKGRDQMSVMRTRRELSWPLTDMERTSEERLRRMGATGRALDRTRRVLMMEKASSLLEILSMFSTRNSAASVSLLRLISMGAASFSDWRVRAPLTMKEVAAMAVLESDLSKKMDWSSKRAAVFSTKISTVSRASPESLLYLMAVPRTERAFPVALYDRSDPSRTMPELSARDSRRLMDETRSLAVTFLLPSSLRATKALDAK